MLRAVLLFALAALVVSVSSGCKCSPKDFSGQFAENSIVGTFKVRSARHSACDFYGDQELEVVQLYKGDCSLKAGARISGKWEWGGQFNGRNCGSSCGGAQLKVGETYLLGLNKIDGVVYFRGCRKILIPANKVTAAQRQVLAGGSQCKPSPAVCTQQCKDNYGRCLFGGFGSRRRRRRRCRRARRACLRACP